MHGPRGPRRARRTRARALRRAVPRRPRAGPGVPVRTARSAVHARTSHRTTGTTIRRSACGRWRRCTSSSARGRDSVSTRAPVPHRAARRARRRTRLRRPHHAARACQRARCAHGPPARPSRGAQRAAARRRARRALRRRRPCRRARASASTPTARPQSGVRRHPLVGRARAAPHEHGGVGCAAPCGRGWTHRPAR